jgi:hypothetical protein
MLANRNRNADEGRGESVATLLSVNVGLPRDVAWRGQTVYTGIWKAPINGPVLARRLNLDGDGQGDLNGHGGEQRAVMVYQVESYKHWREFLGRPDLVYASSVRTSRWTVWLIMRSALAIGTASARPNSK